MESEPVTIEGRGDDVVFIELESGLKHFSLSHDGDRNFIILINGRSLLVNEIGTYEGSTTETVQDNGVYAFAITADGTWRISVE